MAFWTLYKRELTSYFQSAVAYVVLLASAVAQGIAFWVIVYAVMGPPVYRDQSVLQIFFSWQLFWLLLLVQVPLITMRVLSEEYKMGTIEMLLTAPVTEWDVVLAKFFGALSFFLVLWSPIVLDLLLLQLFSSPAPPMYWAQVGLMALTVTLIGGLYISVGIFTSSLTQNQIVAAVFSFVILFAGYIVSLLHWFQHIDANILAWVSYLSAPEHLQNAGMSLFDTRPVVYYVTVTAFILMITKSILEARRLQA